MKVTIKVTIQRDEDHWRNKVLEREVTVEASSEVVDYIPWGKIGEGLVRQTLRESSFVRQPEEEQE